LVTPINGLVTGVFCDLGDCVQAGQPVMRVENDDEVVIVGTIKFRGVLTVGASASITTNLGDLRRRA
jgi:multidrug resistance efflux pump